MKFFCAPLVLLAGICMQLACAAPISDTPIDTVSDLEEFDFAGTASGEDNLYTGTSTFTDTATGSFDEHREADEASYYSDAEIDSDADEIEEPESSDFEEEIDDEIDSDVEDIEEAEDDDDDDADVESFDEEIITEEFVDEE